MRPDPTLAPVAARLPINPAAYHGNEAFLRANREGRVAAPVYNGGVEGRALATLAEIDAFLTGEGFALLGEERGRAYRSRGYWRDPTGYVSVAFSEEAGGSFNYSVGDAASAERLLAYGQEKFSETPPDHEVFVLGVQDKAFTLMPLGKVVAPLERENYAAESLAAFDRCVQDLRAQTPEGRLTLLMGPPGTGKTHFVRGLVHAATGATYVVVPADMVSQLGRPEFVPTLLNHRSGHAVVLILEDADECLVKRMGDNMASISALLQFSDGLLGEMLNLRVLVTTNADRLDLDPALQRDGRLSQVIQLRPLAAEQAVRRIAALTGRDEDDVVWRLNRLPGPKTAGFGERTQLAHVTLGQLYKVARDLGWSPPPAPGGASAPRYRRLRAAVGTAVSRNDFDLNS